MARGAPRPGCNWRWQVGTCRLEAANGRFRSEACVVSRDGARSASPVGSPVFSRLGGGPEEHPASRVWAAEGWTARRWIGSAGTVITRENAWAAMILPTGTILFVCAYGRCRRATCRWVGVSSLNRRRRRSIRRRNQRPVQRGQKKNRSTSLGRCGSEEVEATTGFEPVNGGFANLWLTTCLRRQASIGMQRGRLGQALNCAIA